MNWIPQVSSKRLAYGKTLTEGWVTSSVPTAGHLLPPAGEKKSLSGLLLDESGTHLKGYNHLLLFPSSHNLTISNVIKRTIYIKMSMLSYNNKRWHLSSPSVVKFSLGLTKEKRIMNVSTFQVYREIPPAAHGWGTSSMTT